MKCPSCNKSISWIQKWRFTKGFCSRKVAECPKCGIGLIWSKLPHRLINFGALCIILGSSSVLFFPVKIAGDYDLFSLCTILAFVTITPGVLLLKLEVAGTK